MAQNMYAESLRAFLKPVLKYLDDEAVAEIMINGPTDIWIETKGKLIKTDAVFTEEGLIGCARNIAQFVGRRLTDEAPRLDARLPDGSRVHAVIPPIARKGTTISIRKFFKDKLTIDKLVDFGSMTAAMARFIEGCVIIKENIIVAGGTGSGKTTLLNIVSSLIPQDERILTIEDSAELQLNQEHIVPFESRPADKFGKGEVNMGHLLHSALRLRPDRIVVGEVRGGEAFDLMQAMNTGHGGSMATTHANTPTDTLRRIESLCLQSGIDLPMVAVRAQVASGIQVVITCERLADGSRKTTAIAEVLPLSDKGDYRTQDIFVFTPTHKDDEGKIHGYHSPTGVLPHFLPRLYAYGFTDMTEEFFDPATYNVPPPPIFHADGVTTHWIKKLKYREAGEADGEEREKQWAEDRLKKGKEVEQKAKEAAAAAAAKKAAAAAAAPRAEAAPAPAPRGPSAEAPRPRPQQPEARPQARAETRPSPPTSQKPPQELFDDVDGNSNTGAMPLPAGLGGAPPRSSPSGSQQRPITGGSSGHKVSGSIEIASDLMEEGGVTSQPAPPPRAVARPQQRAPEPEPEAEEEAPQEDEFGSTEFAMEEEGQGEPTRAPSAPPFRKPGPSAPKPTLGVRPVGSRRPAPTRGFGAGEEDPDADPNTRDPRRR